MDQQELLSKIAECVEFGKINKISPYPPQMKDQDGADEHTKMALDEGLDPALILSEALIKAMEAVGQKFSDKKIFVPQMLMSAKAMSAAMAHLKPYFTSGQVKRKGKFIIGTVSGDLHDIGKNLVAMIVEGAGWEVIDLGVDVKSTKFIQTLSENEGAVIGLSALLTTTMVNMKAIVEEIKNASPNTKVIIGGAPITSEFQQQINADFYAPDPQRAVACLNSI